MRNHTRTGVAAAMLIMLIFSAGCAEATSAPEGVLAETITIAAGNELVYESWDRTERYGASEQVEILWESGVVRVNGFVHKPHPKGPEEVRSVEYLNSLYGEVPFIQDYVANGSGSAEALWNSAYRAWVQQRLELLLNVQSNYRALVGQGVAPEEAADASAKLLRENALVASAERDITAPQAAAHQTVYMQWKGLQQSNIVMLDPDEDSSTSANWVSREQADELVLLLKRLESTAIRVRITLAHGNISIRTGSYLSQEMR